MGIPTRAVKAIIKNEKEEVLMMKSPNGVWDLPGGLIDDGESEEEAMIREIGEETGLEAEIISRSGKWRLLREKDNNWVDMQNFLCRIVGGEYKESDEHEVGEWKTYEEIKGLKIKHESFLRALEEEIGPKWDELKNMSR